VQAARNARVWWLAAIWFTAICSYYGILFWGPLIIQQVIDPTCKITGSDPEGCPGKTDPRVLLLSTVPYVAATAALLLNARHSQATGEVRWHIIVPMALCAAGLVLTPVLQRLPAASFCVLTVATAAVWSIYGPTSRLWAETDSGAASAASFALINGGGNLGGLVGPIIIGVFTTRDGDFLPAFAALAGLMVVSAALVALLPLRRAPPAEDSQDSLERVPLGPKEPSHA